MTNRMYWVAGLIALVAIAFSAVTLSSRMTSAQSPDSTQITAACALENEADDAAETDAGEADTDNVEDECGDQNEADGGGEDRDNTQDPQLNGSIAVDESQFDGLAEADEAAALAPLAKISADEAAAAAQAEVPGDVGKVELDNENGSLVYSVDIAGQDVKVDAGTGAVLQVESDQAED